MKNPAISFFFTPIPSTIYLEKHDLVDYAKRAMIKLTFLGEKLTNILKIDNTEDEDVRLVTVKLNSRSALIQPLIPNIKVFHIATNPIPKYNLLKG